MAAPRTSLTTTDELNARTDNESLPTLFSRLGDDVMQLFNSQLALFKMEIKEEANAYARGITMIAIGAVVAIIGFALLNVAIALGFVVTGGFYVLVGAILVMLMKSRLAKQELVPTRTVAELRKDKQWLKNEL